MDDQEEEHPAEGGVHDEGGQVGGAELTGCEDREGEHGRRDAALTEHERRRQDATGHPQGEIDRRPARIGNGDDRVGEPTEGGGGE